MNKLTKEKSLIETNECWKDLARHPGKTKQKYYLRQVKKYKNNCPLCEYVVQERGMPDCSICPIDWPNIGVSPMGPRPAPCEKSWYGAWMKEPLAGKVTERYAALSIAHLASDALTKLRHDKQKGICPECGKAANAQKCEIWGKIPHREFIVWSCGCGYTWNTSRSKPKAAPGTCKRCGGILEASECVGDARVLRTTYHCRSCGSWVETNILPRPPAPKTPGLTFWEAHEAAFKGKKIRRAKWGNTVVLYDAEKQQWQITRNHCVWDQSAWPTADIDATDWEIYEEPEEPEEPEVLNYI